MHTTLTRRARWTRAEVDRYLNSLLDTIYRPPEKVRVRILSQRRAAGAYRKYLAEIEQQRAEFINRKQEEIS